MTTRKARADSSASLRNDKQNDRKRQLQELAERTETFPPIAKDRDGWGTRFLWGMEKKQQQWQQQIPFGDDNQKGKNDDKGKNNHNSRFVCFASE